MGGSVTTGSPGFGCRHPDAPKGSGVDSYASVLEGLLNINFPCSRGGVSEGEHSHKVMNKATPGCSAKCNLEKWSENYQLFAEHKWDIVIIEPTANTPAEEMVHLKALISAFIFLSRSQPSILLLSASFRLPYWGNATFHPTEYKELPEIESEVSNLADQWGIPFISFPKYIFQNNLYNSSNHQHPLHEGRCFEARCNFWLDAVHITKTSHIMVALLLVDAITEKTVSTLDILDVNKNRSNIFIPANNHLCIPPRPNITLGSLSDVEHIMPSPPATWISFRTESLPLEKGFLVCLTGFRTHNSRGRLSTLYEHTSSLSITNFTLNDEYGSRKQYNASLVLEMPNSQCKKPGYSQYKIQIEYLHSYTTIGVFELLSWKEGKAPKAISSEGKLLCQEDKTGWVFVDSFNASNEEKLSVSKSTSFYVDIDVSFIRAEVHGGDFHLLSIGLFCS